MQTYFKIALMSLLFCAGAVQAGFSKYEEDMMLELKNESMGDRLDRRLKAKQELKKLHDKAGKIMDRFGYEMERIKKSGGSVEDYLKTVKQAMKYLDGLFNVDMYKSSVWQLYKILNSYAQDNVLLSGNMDTILKPLQDVGSFKGPLKFEKIVSLASKLESKYKNNDQISSLINGPV